MFFLLLLILPGVRTQVTSSSISPRSYDLPYNSVQFVQHKASKNGPILFPNDAPPPPPTPLIVTSRPLSESIAKSELNPNNTQTAQSQYYQVSFKPEYLARGKNYQPYAAFDTVTPAYDFESSKQGYSDPATASGKDGFYKEYEKLMKIIYERRYSGKLQLQWDRPIQRRTSEQPEKTLNSRSAILEDTNKNTQIKVKPDSLYSREANHKDDDDNDRQIDVLDDIDDDLKEFDFGFEKVLNYQKKIFESNVSEAINDLIDEDSRINMIRRQNLDINNERDFKLKTRKNLPNNDDESIKDEFPEDTLTVDNEETFVTKPTQNIQDKSENIEELIGLKPEKNVERFKIVLKAKKVPVDVPKAKEIPIEQGTVKPLHVFNDIQQQNTPMRAGHTNYQYPTEQFYHPVAKGQTEDKEYNHGENYAFSYTVKDQKTGDDFSHSQKSTGSATNGEYRVRLPDGRMQIVSYTADEHGYKADVRYDENHNQDNSIDDDEKYNRYQSQPVYRHNTVSAYNDPAVPQNTYEKGNYLNHHYNDDKTVQQPITAKRPIYYNNYKNPEDEILFNPTNDYDSANDFENTNDFQNYNAYPTKAAYADNAKAAINDPANDRLSDTNDDYLENYKDQIIEENLGKTKDDDYYKFSDEIDFTKEVMDYSSELGVQYQPHKSKFSSFDVNQNAQSKVRPSYEELKNLFVTNGRRNLAVPVGSTVQPNYAVTPAADVVEITPKKPNLYTSIKGLIPASPTPFVFSTPAPAPSTPRSYLLSTIANLKHQIDLAHKPVLSHEYLNKINKYLSYPLPARPARSSNCGTAIACQTSPACQPCA